MIHNCIYKVIHADMVADELIKNYLLVDETENDFWVRCFDMHTSILY